MLSGIMDKGAQDFQLEAAISKVYSSDSAWYFVDDAIQVRLFEFLFVILLFRFSAN